MEFFDAMNILENVDLQSFNTFGIKVFGSRFVTIASVKEAQALFLSPLFKNSKHLILGGGSNVLFTKNFDGLVVKVELRGIEILKEDDDTVTLKVGAGEIWHQFVLHCVERNWGGVENLSLIPGTVGAAPIQNIGAYGVEIKNIIISVEAVEISTGKIRSFTNAECDFGYRDSIFKQRAKDKYLISSITLKLTKRDHELNTTYGAIEETLKQRGIIHPTVKDISDAVIHIRRSKLPDPEVIGNAGSFFKNPTIDSKLYESIKKGHPSFPSYPSGDGLVKIPAAWLIEQCGWKGKTFDAIGVHKNQALVLVNYGGGDGKQIWQLALDIKASVQERFDINLQPEVNVID
jgi:UDP-N-acetylmuramate dehydrogenase